MSSKAPVKWIESNHLQCKAIVPGTETWNILVRLCCGKPIAHPRVSYCPQHLKAFTLQDPEDDLPIDLASDLAYD